MTLTIDLTTISHTMVLLMEIVGFAWVVWIVCMVLDQIFELEHIDLLELFYDFLDDCSMVATQLFCISSIIVFGLSVFMLIRQYLL